MQSEPRAVHGGSAEKQGERARSCTPHAVSALTEHATRLTTSRVLIVDDEESNLLLLQRILSREGFTNIGATPDAAQALQLFDADRPDVVLLDLHMAPLNGMDVLASVRQRTGDDEYLPVVFLSGDFAAPTRRAALKAGATEFLAKPFDAAEVVLRVRGLLLTRLLHLELVAQNDMLEARVAERTRDLEESRREMFERLCRVAAYRDDATSEHTRRVGWLTQCLALALGETPADAELMGRAAELHDLGKVGVPDQILYKPGRLDDSEMEVMRRHAHIGAEVLTGSRSTLLKLAEQIAREHHERWDGTGYPNRLVGRQISRAARIVAVVDVLDALAHDRPYRPAWPMERVLGEIRAGGGTHFDPAITAAVPDALAMYDSVSPHLR